jgi:hypothetical protein
MNHVLIDSLERFFSLQRWASRDNFVGFTNSTGLAFGDNKAVYQLNACDGRR